MDNLKLEVLISVWKNLRLGFVKINFDVLILNGLGLGLGIVVRFVVMEVF